MPKWLQEVDRYACENVIKVIVGCKNDLNGAGQRAIFAEEGKELASGLDIPFFEVSSKANTGLEELFLAAASLVKKRLDE